MANSKKDPIREYLARIGREGGKKTSPTKGFGKLTEEERRENSRKASERRWAEHNKKKAALAKKRAPAKKKVSGK